MKILYLLQSSRFSGAENVVCQIISMLKSESDIEMVYCSPDGQIREALLERGVTFEPLHGFSVKEVKRVIAKCRPDVVHAHDMKASFIAALACGNTPLISHVHNNNFNSRGLSLKSLAYAFAAKRAKHIFWVSKSSFNGYAFHNRFEKKSTVLYNIIDVDSLYEKMHSDDNDYNYDLIYVGRLSHPKNPQRLIRVLEKVVEKIPNVKIGIVGTGELENETKALCHELSLDNNVEFLGFQNNPLKMMHDAKAMIMTSRFEGTPMCALEAMALGVPIISTPTDGLCELITDDVTGYLSDDDDVLAAKIAETIASPELHSYLSANSKARSLKINDIPSYKNILLKAYST